MADDDKRSVERQGGKTAAGSGKGDSWLLRLSHDLRNPVHGILSYAGFGIKKGAAGKLTPEKSQHYYERIREAGENLLDMIEDLVTLEKLAAGRIALKRSEHNLATAVEGAISHFRRKNGAAEPTFEPPDAPVTARFDLKLVTEVIRRLLSGCLSTVEDCSRLRIGVSVVDAADNPLQQRAVGFRLTHPDAAFSEERLAELRCTLDETAEGPEASGQMGLNLAICRATVARHCGRIWIEKRDGGGVEFGFLLPVD